MDGVPDYGGAQVPVGVDGKVPKIDHLALGDFRMAACDFCRNVVCCFADHSQVVNYGVHDLFVVFKRLEINSGDIALDFVDCFEDVLDPESPVSRRHGWLLAECVLLAPA